MRFRQKKELDQTVDISPLIDMVFILLIFFMVSTTFVKDMKLDLERPGATSATRASSKVIKVYLDNQPIKVWAIQSKLRDMLRASTEKSVLVVTDDTIPVEKLIEVVDQCRLSGAKDVAVAAKKEVG